MESHSLFRLPQWADALLNETTSPAAPYIDGIAYHWYAGGMDRLLDGALGIPNLHRLAEQLDEFNSTDNDFVVLGSESCHCPTTGYAGGDILNYWSRAERYGHTILADLAAGSTGWVEWNLILDGIGGPNHLGNLCEATLLAVPHRANNVPIDMDPLPSFETDRPMGNFSIGDGRTREELNALGFPAKFLDVGIAVQPMYYYMGHISRHVRPGSLAVMGLVTSPTSTSSRIFRPEGQVVAGGGQNDLARDGIELTVWPCEGSTRQQFHWDGDDSKFIQVFSHDWLGKPTESCIARQVDKDLHGMRLTPCTHHEAGMFDFIPLDVHDPKNKGVYNVVLRNHPKVQGQCLVIAKLKNNGGAYGPRGGAQLALGGCSDASARWKINPETGEASSLFFATENDSSEVCLTTGWPFLQMGAFLTPNKSKTIVILNEANAAANFRIQNEQQHVLLASSIPARSIQTVSLD
jgi:glucosylceramidase